MDHPNSAGSHTCNTHQDYAPSKGSLHSRSGSSGSRLRRMSQDMEADNFSAEDDLSE